MSLSIQNELPFQRAGITHFPTMQLLLQYVLLLLPLVPFAFLPPLYLDSQECFDRLMRPQGAAEASEGDDRRVGARREAASGSLLLSLSSSSSSRAAGRRVQKLPITPPNEMLRPPPPPSSLRRRRRRSSASRPSFQPPSPSGVRAFGSREAAPRPPWWAQRRGPGQTAFRRAECRSGAPPQGARTRRRGAAARDGDHGKHTD